MAMDAKEVFARQETTAQDIRQHFEKEPSLGPNRPIVDSAEIQGG